MIAMDLVKTLEDISIQGHVQKVNDFKLALDSIILTSN